MRKIIQDFLIEGPEGAFFYRMVESILSRDKNWVRWKLEGCPPIELPGLSTATFNKSKGTVERISKKRLRQSTGGLLNLDFLQPPDPDTMWDKYRDPERYKLPDLKTVEKKIANAKLDVEMTMTDEAKAEAEEILAAQTWRAMRIAASSKIICFDKVEDYRNVDAIFTEVGEQDKLESSKAKLPQDDRAVVISGPSGVGKLSLVSKLSEARPDTFKLVPRLTSRKQADGEAKGEVFDFVSKSDIDVLMDRDQIIEFEEVSGHLYATSRSSIEVIRESGKVPILRLNPTVSRSWVELNIRNVLLTHISRAHNLSRTGNIQHGSSSLCHQVLKTCKPGSSRIQATQTISSPII